MPRAEWNSPPHAGEGLGWGVFSAIHEITYPAPPLHGETPTARFFTKCTFKSGLIYIIGHHHNEFSNSLIRDKKIRAFS